jgi:kynurenine 3-monooxygenase
MGCVATATLHIGETERGAWEDKKYDMVLVQMVLFQNSSRNTHQSMFDYSQEFLPIGYKELNIPAMQMEHKLDKNSFHIWPRGESC